MCLAAGLLHDAGVMGRARSASAAPGRSLQQRRDSRSSEIETVNEAKRERERAADAAHVGCFPLNGRGSWCPRRRRRHGAVGWVGGLSLISRGEGGGVQLIGSSGGTAQ